jgi:hypothetical protein
MPSSFTELLEQAIAEQDWAKAADAFELVTGRRPNGAKPRPAGKAKVKAAKPPPKITDGGRQAPVIFGADLTLAAADIAHDKKWQKKRRPVTRDRPAYEGKVKVACDVCKKDYECEKWEANIEIGGSKTRNLCPKCLHVGRPG